ADTDPIAGTWTVTGGDPSGAYSGSARVETAGARYKITLHYTYTGDQAGEATFDGALNGSTLTGDRKPIAGFVGAISGSNGSVSGSFKLSADGTTLVGKFGSTTETLTRPTAETTATESTVKL